MKKSLNIIFAIMLFACFSVHADNMAAEEPYKVIVNNSIINLDDLPSPPYEENEIIMVPLRKISEALGYNVN